MNYIGSGGVFSFQVSTQLLVVEHVAYGLKRKECEKWEVTSDRFNPDEISSKKISLGRLGKRDKFRASGPLGNLASLRNSNDGIMGSGLRLGENIGMVGLENQNEYNCIDFLVIWAYFFGRKQKTDVWRASS